MADRHLYTNHDGARSTMRKRSPREARRRSRSPDLRHRHKHHKHNHTVSSSTASRSLPLGAQQLSKHDYKVYESILASYLDIQKGIILGGLDRTEVKGRWKSFMGKWNRGELAEGWYDPSALQKAASAFEPIQALEKPRRRPSPGYDEYSAHNHQQSNSSSGDEGPGPSLPNTSHREIVRLGPAIPGLQDLALRNESNAEDAEAVRLALRHERQANRALEKERLNDLQPRAEAGTKERQMEKKKELASSNRAFAVAKEGDGMADVPEAELLGGEEEGIEGYKKQKKEMERKKNEREIRREEIMRVRREEREIRAQEFREREERTMQGLVELARRRFG